MNDLSKRLAELSPEKLALMAMRLSKEHNRSARKKTIPRRKESSNLSLSFAQERLWFIDQLEPGSFLYNVPFSLRLQGQLNVAALQQSLNEIVRRHEVLRTTFAINKDQPVQIITPSLTLELRLTDLSGDAPSERQAITTQYITAEAQLPFDLSTGPLLRMSLARLGEQDYILLLTMHHIVSDGWSAAIFIRELTTLYESYSRGERSPLPELEIQYADYAVWQREWLTGEVLAEQLSYWKEQLRGAPAMLELPTDHPRPAVQSHRGAVKSFGITGQVATSLKEMSRRSDVTLFMSLLAAFEVLLWRYSAQTDIVIGTPIANRNRAEIEALIGFFVNTLVLRTEVRAEESFAELVKRVREVCLGAYSHQDVPFEKVVEELQPERSLSHQPIFQVIFQLLNDQAEELTFGDLIVSPVNVKSETAKFDLTLSIADTEQGLIASLGYNSDLFEDETIERLRQHFQNLLAAIADDPEQKVSQLSLTSAAEREQVVVEWNQTARDYPSEQCIHQLFEAQVVQTPDAVAIVFEEEQVSYRELNERANQLAHYLQAQGVGPEVLVGLCMQRSVEMIVALLAILKAGGVYVPLDPSYPQQRLSFMLDDAALTVLLAQSSLSESLPPSQAQVVYVDRDWEHISAHSIDNPSTTSNAENLAYIIYTSGSTGIPKGVAVSHRAVIRLISNTNYVQLQPADKMAQVSNSSFDASTFEVWGALLHGAQLVLISTDVALSPHDFAAHLKQQGITVMFLTTALFNQLGSEVPTIFDGLRDLLFGGEAVDPKRVRELLRGAGPQRLLHVYGPTETTTFATWYEVEDVAEGATTVPIGRPISNTEVYILDERMESVPVGVAGDLYIGGDGLARGYWNRPELTAERFVAHPFSVRGGARLYRTGDVGRYLAGGEIEFIGRRDQQVKIRGYRIELGEIEAALMEHDGVQECAVAMRENVAGDKRLVAYVVAEDTAGGDLTATQLRSFIKERLPEYMVPAAIVKMEALPLTENGKVDRKSLPVPEESGMELAHNYVAPRTAAEEVVAGVWVRVMKLKRAGVHDNFFDLGGHSLMATQVVSRLREAFRVELPLRTLFERPTVAGLVDLLAQLWGGMEIVEEIARTLQELDRLSPEEVRALLENG